MLWLVWHKLIIVVLSIFLAVNGILLYQLISAFSCFFKISGRRLTSQGTRDLDRIAGQVRNSFGDFFILFYFLKTHQTV